MNWSFVTVLMHPLANTPWHSLAQQRVLILTLDHCFQPIFEHTHMCLRFSSYRPLDCAAEPVRLLRILPVSSCSDTVHCKIWHGSIDMMYRCLSYVWDPKGEVEEILLNGRDFAAVETYTTFPGQLLQVTRRKYSGLRTCALVSIKFTSGIAKSSKWFLSTRMQPVLQPGLIVTNRSSASSLSPSV
jgi:hypothetical protein